LEGPVLEDPMLEDQVLEDLGSEDLGWVVRRDIQVAGVQAEAVRAAADRVTGETERYQGVSDQKGPAMDRGLFSTPDRAVNSPVLMQVPLELEILAVRPRLTPTLPDQGRSGPSSAPVWGRFPGRRPQQACEDGARDQPR
jgi:hypothetical protein